MKRLLAVLLLVFASAALAQDRMAELDAAVAEARVAYNALQAAIARRDRGVESEPFERNLTIPSGNCATESGRCNRYNAFYMERMAQLEGDVELAQRRYDAAVKRWNYLK